MVFGAEFLAESRGRKGDRERERERKAEPFLKGLSLSCLIAKLCAIKTTEKNKGGKGLGGGGTKTHCSLTTVAFCTWVKLQFVRVSFVAFVVCSVQRVFVTGNVVQ